MPANEAKQTDAKYCIPEHNINGIITTIHIALCNPTALAILITVNTYNVHCSKQGS